MALEVLVTGANGVLGSEIVQALRKAGHSTIRSGRSLGKSIDVAWDIAKDAGPSPVSAPDVVVHAAAKTGRLQQPIGESQEMFEANVGGTIRVADWCVAHDVKRLVFISGAIVYGRWGWSPKSESDIVEAWAAGPYAVSKLCGEKTASLVLNEDIDLAILRLSSLYGPGYQNGLPQRLINEGREKGVIELSQPFDDGFDLLHISDAAETVVKTVESVGSGVWNAGSGRVTTIKELAQLCADSVQSRVDYLQSPPGRESRIINWVNDYKARHELNHRNDVAIEAGINALARIQIGTS